MNVNMLLETSVYVLPPQSMSMQEMQTLFCINSEGQMKITHNVKLAYRHALNLWGKPGNIVRDMFPFHTMWGHTFSICGCVSKSANIHYFVTERACWVWRDRYDVMKCSCGLSFAVKSITWKQSFSTCTK